MKQLETIKEHWEIRYRDIDPDTGDTVTNEPIAITRSERYARWIIHALAEADLEPNREFYIFKLNEIKL
jgi:hypothetical protein